MKLLVVVVLALFSTLFTTAIAVFGYYLTSGCVDLGCLGVLYTLLVPLIALPAYLSLYIAFAVKDNLPKIPLLVTATLFVFSLLIFLLFWFRR